MSKLNLYESNWINLVFENKNKEYGAFQLRQQTTKTSIHALSLGVLLCTALIVLPGLLSRQQESTATILPELPETIVQLADIYSEQIKEEAAAAALPEIKQQQPTENIDTKQLINPTVVSATQATPAAEYSLSKNNPTESTVEGTAISGSNTSGISGGVADGTGTSTGTAVSNTNGTEIITTELLDKKPQFPGGIEKFYRYVINNFNSPTLDEGKAVRIFISFVVEKDGSMSNIKVLNKPGAVLEKEAIRVLQSIKAKWTPGMVNSTAVRTAYNLPITIQIE